jgi:hypothetical protein
MAGRELTEEQADKRDLEELDDALDGADGDDDEPAERPEPQRASREAPDDDGEDPEAYLVEEERRPPRRERKNNRYDDLQRERDAERDQRIRLEAQLASLQRPAQQQGPSIEEFEAQARAEARELQKVELKLTQFAQARGENLTQAEIDDILEQRLNIDIAKQKLGARLARAHEQASAPPAVDPGLAYLKARYNDVVNDPLGVAEAQRHYLLEVRKGRADGLDLVEEAYQAARAALRGEPAPKRPGARPRPTEESRARYAGQSSRGASSASPSNARTVTISREEAALAKELYKYEKDPQKRLQKYVTEVKRPSDAADAAERRRRA